jgi:cystathionine beta-synthase
MKLLHDGVDFTKQVIFAVMGKPLPALDEDTEVSEAYRLLLSGTAGIIVTSDEVPIGVITRADLVNHWMAQKEA